MIDKERVEEMSDSKEKKLMEILLDKGKPYKKKFDGYAVKVEDDIQIEWTDYDNRENTTKIPAGSYVMVGEDSSCPHVVTAEEWDDSNKFVDEESKPKKPEKNKPEIGLASLEG